MTGSPPRAWGRPRIGSSFSCTHRFTPTCVGKTETTSSRLPHWPVHPHVRGEDDAAGLLHRSVPGSPPRAWGRRSWRRQERALTPVHPHVRGEDAATSRRMIVPSGSPPRAWGRRERYTDLLHRQRFTPTCVGKTIPNGSGPIRSPVHPHVRGEDVRAASVASAAAGSPPRAWGRLKFGDQRVGVGRFTPTCVGKTTRTPTRSSRLTVHSPRAWGRRGYDQATGYMYRFTPTCVGKTVGLRRERQWRTVHPHVRGEDGLLAVVEGGEDGSPPRAWGRLLVRAKGIACPRFTPTCVGKTKGWQDYSGLRTVHPHVRGEDHRVAHGLCLPLGSPPRAWGRPLPKSTPTARSRFTPTCVGKTSPDPI